MISRRLFLGGLFSAPAIVHAENLMKIWTPLNSIDRATNPFWIRGNLGIGTTIYTRTLADPIIQEMLSKFPGASVILI